MKENSVSKGTEAKTEVLTVRLRKDDASRIRRLARQERRTVSNMIEVMLTKNNRASNGVKSVGSIKAK